MIFVFIGFVVVTFLMCIAEIAFERDWPKATFGRFAISVSLLCAWLWIT